jgi:hypothetical protein
MCEDEGYNEKKIEADKADITVKELTAYSPARVPLGELVKRRADERYQDLPTEELAKKLVILQPSVEKHTKDKELEDKNKVKTGYRCALTGCCSDLENFLHFRSTFFYTRCYSQCPSPYLLLCLHCALSLSPASANVYLMVVELQQAFETRGMFH